MPIGGLGTHVELWPMLLEKAVAMASGSYKDVEYGYGDQAFDLLLPTNGKKYPIAPTNAEGVFASISAALTAHRPTTAGSIDTLTPTLKPKADEVNLVLSHEYAIKSVDGSKKTIQLQNPYGRNDLDLTAADFVQLFDEYCVAG